MKKIHLFLFAALFLVIAACNKDNDEPVYTPAKNTWLVNNDTIGPASFTYYDTANVMYGGIKGKASVTVSFRFKPKVDGKYVFRDKADEIDEIAVLVIDSVRKIYWMSTNDDGLPMKKEQFANVTVNGNNIGVAFNNLFLKRIDNPDKASVSININQ